MFKKLLDNMEKETKLLVKNFEKFDKKGVFSSVQGQVKLASIKTKLMSILFDIEKLQMDSNFHLFMDELKGEPSIIELGQALNQVSLKSEKISKKLKLALTRKQRLTLMKELEIAQEEWEMLYTQFAQRCEEQYPSFLRVGKELMEYKKVATNIEIKLNETEEKQR